MNKTPSSPLTENSELGFALSIASIQSHFSALRDTRRRRGRRHRMLDVVIISFLGMLCGCDDAEEISDWARHREAWLTELFDLNHGTPSQDTILRIFSMLKPERVSECLVSWAQSLMGPSARHIAIDGKTLRGSRDGRKGLSGIHLVSAWLRDSGLVLGQVKTEAKSNEITAIPELLELIEVCGSVVTIDAMGCQREIASAIDARGGYYLLAVKDNQPSLLQDIQKTFEEGEDDRRRSCDEIARPELCGVEDTDTGHGRIDERAADITTDLDFMTTRAKWPSVRAVGRITTRSTDAITGDVRSDQRYYITNHPALDAENFLDFTRGHWSIENQLHWVLDVTFREDGAQIRHRRCAENLSVLRRMVLGLLRAAPKPKKRMTLRRFRRFCRDSPENLESVLNVLMLQETKKMTKS